MKPFERKSRNKRPNRYDDGEDALIIPTKKVKQLKKKDAKADPVLKQKKKEYSSIASTETSKVLLGILSEPHDTDVPDDKSNKMQRWDRCTRNKLPVRYLDGADDKKLGKKDEKKTTLPKVTKTLQEKIKKDPAIKQQIKKYNSIVSNEAAEVLLGIAANDGVKETLSSTPNTALLIATPSTNHQPIIEVRSQQSYDNEQSDVVPEETSSTQKVLSDSGECEASSAQPPYGAVHAEKKDDERDFGERSDDAPEEAKGLQKTLIESVKPDSCLTELSRITVPVETVQPVDTLSEGRNFAELNASPHDWDRQIFEPNNQTYELSEIASLKGAESSQKSLTASEIAVGSFVEVLSITSPKECIASTDSISKEYDFLEDSMPPTLPASPQISQASQQTNKQILTRELEEVALPEPERNKACASSTKKVTRPDPAALDTNSTSSLSSSSNACETVVLSYCPKEGKKKISFTVLRDYLIEAYQKKTFQAVVKALGLAYVTPNAMLNNNFRKKTLPAKIVENVIHITYIVLKMKDEFTQQPILYIVRVGENEKMVKRNKKVDEVTAEPEVETQPEGSTNPKERIMKYKSLLTTENVRKILSAGFKEYRQSEKKKTSL